MPGTSAGNPIWTEGEYVPPLESLSTHCTNLVFANTWRNRVDFSLHPHQKAARDKGVAGAGRLPLPASVIEVSKLLDSRTKLFFCLMPTSALLRHTLGCAISPTWP